MRILFIGGTGNISTECVELALERGHQVSVLSRGQRPLPFSQPVRQILGDRHDPVLLRQTALDGKYDVVANFIGYTPEEIEMDIAAFSGQVGQYLFISSASAYQKPPNHYLTTESTPLCNPFWEYSRLKIACEERLNAAYRTSGFPMTIVRPSYTYGKSWIPSGVGGQGYTVTDRMRRRQPVVSHGDGQSLWVMTSASDFALGFVGLMGRFRAIGEAFHITSDEVLTWDQIYLTIARAAGCTPQLVHIPSEAIAARYTRPGASLLGDKAYSTVFDNSKIKRVVPDFRARISFAEGMERSMAWFDADPRRQQVDPEVNAMLDRLCSLKFQ
jgi:nucleoside-diphosphate-sugar epimerase